MDSDLSVIAHRIQHARPIDVDALNELRAACESIGERLAAAERTARDLAALQLRVQFLERLSPESR